MTRPEATIPSLTLRTGFEVELLAPAGSDRQTLAEALADRHAGRVTRSFHMDSEPSAVPGVGVFRHLSPAFDVVDGVGTPVARLADDITLTADLVGTTARPGHRGWYRLLCDEPRLLRLIERFADPAAPLPEVLAPVAELFGTRVEVVGGAARVNDSAGATVAVVMPLPAGRERPCEVITPPITTSHGRALEDLLGPARDLGFTVPAEAAVHLHLDGGPFRRPAAFANLVRLFAHWRDPLWAALGTNSECRRLAPLPAELLELVDRGDHQWPGLQAAAREIGLTKYADVNLTQLVSARPVRDTVEVRILPGAIDTSGILGGAALVESLLRRCLDDAPVPRPDADAARDPAGALEAMATTGAVR
ncbi:amidoligase family protein [Actinotalea sp. C106]|uniref:amidoligase family protein n=1 Tax=Actinotalea sp. C106 TaxID=2908644 RepID=UPI00202982A5|nr:amidoligase family protein [Actinotalea sp. C106]